jgi:hypothetical protein
VPTSVVGSFNPQPEQRFGSSIAAEPGQIAIGAPGSAASATGLAIVYDDDFAQDTTRFSARVIATSNAPNVRAIGTTIDLKGRTLAVGAPRTVEGAFKVEQGAVLVYDIGL